MSFHTVILIGNLGADPEMKYLPSGTAVTNFSVASNATRKNKDGETVKKTTWFRVAVFDKQAEACANYLHKGSLVAVEGDLNADPETGGPRTFTRNDGTTGASYEVFAHNVRFLSSSEAQEVEPMNDDQIPF